MVDRQRSTRMILLVALGLFFVLTVLLTWPVTRQLTTDVAGGGSDTHQTMAEVLKLHRSYADAGAWSSIWDTLSQARFDTVTVVTYLTTLVGLPASYNLYWLFSFILSGWATYLLTRSILAWKTGDDRPHWALDGPAFLAGLAFAFTPAHLAWSMSFRGATHLEWIPLTTYALWQFIRRPAIRWALLLIVSAAFLVNSDPHFVVAYAVFVVPFIVYALRAWPQTLRLKSFWVWSLIGLAAIGTILATSQRFLLTVATSNNNFLAVSKEAAERYSNDLLSTIVPPFTQTLWGPAFGRFREQFTGNPYEHSAYIGVVMLLLIILGATWRTRLKGAFFWIGMSVILYLLSMGPALHVAGPLTRRVSLPYDWLLGFVPGLENIRSVDRFAAVALMGFAVAAGFGLQALLRSFSRRRSLGIVSVAAVGLFLLEMFPAPYPTTALTYPPFYNELHQEAGEFAIIEIPGATNYRAASRFSYYQAIHRKQMINTFQFARTNPSDAATNRILSTPLLRELLVNRPRDSYDYPTSAFDTRDPQMNLAVLNQANIRYIILHDDYVGTADDEMEPDDYAALQQFIETSLPVEKRTATGGLIIYRVLGQSDRPWLARGSGWGDEVRRDDGVYQVIHTGATLTVAGNQTNRPASLVFRAAVLSPAATVRLQVRSDTTGVRTFFVNETTRDYSLPLPAADDSFDITFDYNTSSNAIVGLTGIGIRVLSPLEEQAISRLTAAPDQRPLVILPYDAGSALTVDQPIDPRFLTNPFLDQTLFTSRIDQQFPDSVNDIVTPTAFAAMWQEAIVQSGFRTIAVDTIRLTGKSEDVVRSFITNQLPVTGAQAVDDLMIFSIGEIESQNRPWLFPLNGWGSLEIRDDGAHVRKMNQRSSFFLQQSGTEPRASTFKLDLRTCSSQPQRITVTYDTVVIAATDITTTDFQPISVPLTMTPGNHTLELSRTKGLGTTADDDCPVWARNASLE